MACVTEEAESAAAHTFSQFANWIIPGKVLLGRYPYVEPSRCRYGILNHMLSRLPNFLFADLCTDADFWACFSQNA